MRKLNSIIHQFERQIEHFDAADLNISEGSVGWHIEHSLLVIDGVAKFLAQSNPKDYKWSFNFTRSIVFLSGKIPRGRVKAPRIVKPTENISLESLKKHIASTKNNIKAIEVLSNNKYFEHKIFGKLKLKKTVRFLCVHSNHHLKIANDIIG